MATQFDVRADTQPQLKYRRANTSHAALDAAILAAGGHGYTQAILNTLTRNDKVMICHDYSITINGSQV